MRFEFAQVSAMGHPHNTNWIADLTALGRPGKQWDQEASEGVPSKFPSEIEASLKTNMQESEAARLSSMQSRGPCASLHVTALGGCASRRLAEAADPWASRTKS